MEIFKMTFTGADDSISPSLLAKIAKQYPFIEFGILTKNKIWERALFSTYPFRKEKYPSSSWIESLVGLFSIENLNKHLSLHICPPFTYEIEDINELNELGGFSRVQLNANPARLKIKIPTFSADQSYGVREKQIILQFNGEDVENLYLDSMKSFNRTCAHYKHQPIHGNIPIVGLFDLSGGQGKLPPEWRKPFYNFSYKTLIGYAGGLNPDNLEENIEKIEEVAGDNYVWLDMETGCRTNNAFDLQKVELCCEIIANYKDKK
jgi:phosphoribosylanthranilate isomerase